ncbi:MAG TPA: hypothetical protein VKR58_05715 [Aquella sp.]|nr:hypothetical protein [Aquella sp.]
MAGRPKTDRNFKRQTVYHGLGLVIVTVLSNEDMTLTIKTASGDQEVSYTQPIPFTTSATDGYVEAVGSKWAAEASKGKKAA